MDEEWLNIEAMIALFSKRTRARAWAQIQMMAYYLIFMVVLNIELLFIPIPGRAGMPNSCPVPGHGGPPCKMEKCAGVKPDGTPSGNNCSKYCAEKCCLCSMACPKDHNQYPDQGEEWLSMGFGD